MTLYGIVRVLKFLAVLGYVSAGVTGLVASEAALRKRAVHGVASPALLALWAAGVALAWLRGTSFHELWLLGGLALSFGSNLVLITAVTREPRSRMLIVGYALPIVLAIVLMVLRPKWSALGL
jgi:hypothetical protein